jgi:hypothetical protein
VLTAVAAQDFQLLADAPAAAQRTGDFYEVGAACARGDAGEGTKSTGR